MRTPTRVPGRSVSRARHAFEIALFAVSLGATPALATHYVVDPIGGGDFTTIQAAIDQQFAVYRDTIFVLPGDYPETIALPPAPAPMVRVIATGGASVTSVNSLTVPDDNGAGSIRSYNFEGFTFTQDVLMAKQYMSRARFAHCVFQQVLSSNPMGSASSPIVSDCDFYGPTTFQSSYGTWQGLRFHGAPLTITSASGAGSYFMQNCTFEGPADTLVYMPWANYDVGNFDRCVFSGAGKGIVYGGDCWNVNFTVSNCRFTDLAGAAIWLEDSHSASGQWLTGMNVVDSRFERCGTAVHWVHLVPDGAGNGNAVLARDTVLASLGDGIVLGPQVAGGLTDCIVDGGAANGASFLQNRAPSPDGFTYAGCSVIRTHFTNNAGDGLSVQDTFPGPLIGYRPLMTTEVTDCTFAHNGGVGLEVVAGRWKVQNCVSFGNGDHGFSFRSTSPGYPNALISNTSVLNQGDGFRLVAAPYPGDSLHVLRHNLAVMNTGAGLRVPQQPLGSYAFNDAWSNYLGQHVGPASPADSNLAVDPRFCDLAAGDLGLQQGSPCGAGGVYGLIGARPESCPNTTGVEGAVPRLSFAVRPSVARGSVEFVPPALGPEGRVEVFDLSGRRLWSAPFGPATGTLRWQGDSGAGRARAGLYWVRFTRGGESEARRLVWLE